MTARHIAALLASLVIAGCVSETRNIAPNHVLAKGQGLVISTITGTSPYAHLPAMLYRRVGGGEEGALQAEGRPGLIAVALPEGDYEVFSWRVTVEDGWIVPAKPFQIGFHVTSGEAVYLGSYDFNVVIRAQPIAASDTGVSVWLAQVTCTDQSERDIKGFAVRYPRLPVLHVSGIDPKACRNRLGDGSAFHGQTFPDLDF